MPHVRIEGLAARDDQDDGAQHLESQPTIVHKKLDRVDGAERAEHGGVQQDSAETQKADGGKPQNHHWAKHLADRSGACALNSEKRHDDYYRERHDKRLEAVGDNLKPLHRTQNRDRGRDHAVPIKQGGTEQS
jgi:hypothetical protein